MKKSHLMFSLLVVIVAVTGGVLLSRSNVEGARKPIINLIDIKVVSPNGGEQFIKGNINTITWSGGNRIVAVGLVKSEATVDIDVASAGLIVGWINNAQGERFFPVEGLATWDGLKVCDLAINADSTCRDVVPGNYKIITLSENSGGSIYIGSGTGATFKYTKRDFHGNWDLSDQLFTIVAQ